MFELRKGIKRNLTIENQQQVFEQIFLNEFLDIMNRELTYKNWTYEFTIIPKKNHWQLQFKDWNLPAEFKLFSLNDWIEYSGAEIID